MAKQDYEEDWGELPVEYLILSVKGKYIVFLDHELDLDWKTTDEFDQAESSQEIQKDFNEVKNEIDSLETIPHNLVDKKIIVNFKRQVGESLVRALDRDFENAKRMIKIARDYIINRNIEQSRLLYLMSSGLTAIIFIIIALILWLLRDYILPSIGNTAFFLLFSSITGSIGALLSIILRLGKSNIDYCASVRLHYLEGVSRIIAGMISAFLIALSIKTGILLPIFNKIESTNLAMVLGGLIAGASERFAPSIINKLDSLKQTNKR